MIDKRPLLSICIPCYKRVEQVINTIKSIYETNSDVALEDYEVVISDNDPESELENPLKAFSEKPNFRYNKTKCEGFMNSYYALTYGCGKYLKLHNSQNMFKKGVLSIILNDVRNNLKDKKYLFYSNGNLEKGGYIYCKDFDSFIDTSSFWNSWSGAFGIWKEDFDSIKGLKMDPLFPHVSLLLTQNNKAGYVINDNPLIYAQRIPKRGDHNKFKAFTIHYPSLLEQAEEEGKISRVVKQRLYRCIYTKYLPSLLFNKYVARIETYDSKGYYLNSKRYFPKGAWFLSWLNVPLVPFRIIRKRIRARAMSAKY